MAARAQAASSLALPLLLLLTLCNFVANIEAARAPSALTKADLDARKSLFVIQEDGSFGSFEATYQAVRAYEVADGGVPDLPKTCSWLLNSKPENVSSVYFSVKAVGILNCENAAALAKEGEPILLAAAKERKDLLPLYYSLVGLSYIKEKGWTEGSYVDELSGTFSNLQSLAYGGGTWRYSPGSASSAKATGLALEAGAALVSIGVQLSSSQISSFKRELKKLFDSVAREEGQTFMLLDGPGDETSGGSSSVAATSAVVKGAISFATALNTQLVIANDLVEGANFLLEASPASAFDAFYQLDALAVLNNNNILIPLVLQWPTTVSVSKEKNIEAAVMTVLGDAPPSVTLKTAGGAGINGKEFVKIGENKFSMELPVEKLTKLVVSLEVSTSDPKYSAGDSLTRGIKLVGLVQVSDAKLQIFDSEGTVPDSETMLVFGESETVTLSATHLQKLALTFKLIDPFKQPFTAQQAILKFTHESGLEYLFLIKSSAGQYSIKLEFLEMMEKLYYLSGIYSLELTVGDSLLENSFSWKLGAVDLDLPAAPESAPKPPEKQAPLETRFGPKKEIFHIFRAPEKRPPLIVSYFFTALVLLPLLGLVFGFYTVGVNFKGLPSSGLPLVATIAFHGGIAAILGLYFLFWIKLNLFFTLKALVVLALFTSVPGYFALSSLADASAKQKTA